MMAIGELFSVDGPLYHPLRWAHILAGSVALFAAPVALAMVKGSVAHRRAGWVFVAAMGIVAATALVLSLMTGKTFLLLIAVFSFYLSVSGIRMLRLKHKTAEERAPQLFDYMLSGFMAIASLGLIVMGFKGLRGNGFAVVYLVFGVLSLTLVASEFRARKAAETDRKKWLSQHIQRMIAAYIATVTAFSAVNFGRWFPWMPSVVIWLWATVVGTGFIAYNIARYVRGKKTEAVHVRLG